MTEIQCYNKGCGKKFKEENNTDECCQHHPGVPVFHDALKGWSCCKKRSTDFTEFLNIPGCTKGKHSNEKPVETEKKEEPNPQEEIIVKARAPLKRQDIAKRPSAEEAMIKLPVTIGASLKQVLDKRMNELSLQESANAESGVKGQITSGTSCKNSACKATYVDENSDLETCLYHPGVPIFHEGMKYWSCCQRKTSDFDNFLNQEGCVRGQHVWLKKETPGVKKEACRYDWHQTGNFVTLSVFSKASLPDQSFVQVNRVAINIYIVFNGGSSIFEKSIILKGVIDPEKSNVKMLGTKVEINMRKSDIGSWSTLEFPSETKVSSNSGADDDMSKLAENPDLNKNPFE